MIKMGLYGTVEIDDDVIADVKKFAAYLAEQKKKL
jgi:hypothetical protein